MPSINYCLDINLMRRIRVNVCEGQVNITEETRDDRGLFRSTGSRFSLNRDQAKALADKIYEGLNGNF